MLNIQIFNLVNYFSKQNIWERKLLSLDAERPKLGKAEYVEMLVEKGFNRRRSNYIYNLINAYINIDKFSMYPNDSINHYYLKKESDLVQIINDICAKFRIHNKNVVHQYLREYDSDAITVETLLSITKEQKS